MAEPKDPGKPKDLTAKIAAAYRSIPAEKRDKAATPDEDIQNPELDRAFEKMVQTYRSRRPEPTPVVPFPRSSALPADDLDDEASEQECPECGNTIPPASKYCAECGAAKEDAVALQRKRESASELAATSSGSGIKHHHHYYHHHHYRNNPYLLAAIVLLLGFIAWMQWQEKQSGASPAMVPAAVPARQVAPAVIPSPTPVPAETQAPAPSPAPSRKARAKRNTAQEGSRRLPELVPPPKVTPNPPRQ